MPKRLSVKDLRASMGLSQSQFATRIWGKHKNGAEREAHARTVARWERGQHQPQSLHRQALERLRDEHEATKQGETGKTEPAGPRRHKATHLPSTGEAPTHAPKRDAAKRDDEAPADAGRLPHPGNPFLPSMS